MSMTAITTAATLRTRSESPFVLPSGQASLQLPVTNPENAFGFARGTSIHDATFMVIKPAPMGRGDVQAAKQDRPPRGVPR
ncbi:MAG: hypothetical protein DLM58_07695 [Pseudonocardiales bacterium]|nr:MAG: hypothetical protein DLM58_07695 [Pseudonocardiales bacterium]